LIKKTTEPLYKKSGELARFIQRQWKQLYSFLSRYGVLKGMEIFHSFGCFQNFNPYDIPAFIKQQGNFGQQPL